MKAYIAIFLVGCALGALVNGWRLNADISELKTVHSDKLRTISDKALATQQSLQAELDENEKLWATAEAIQYRKLRDAEDKINQLRDDVAAGRKRLLVNATCPAGGDNMPETEASTSMDNGVTPRLTEDAEQAYYDLKRGIERVTNQLLACQAGLKSEP